MVALDRFLEWWNSIWGVLGPLVSSALLLLILYLTRPEKFERVAVHALWALSAVASQVEKRALSKEIEYITGSRFKEFFPTVERIPRIEVEWGKEERVVLDVERGKLILVLRRGRSKRFDNVARALVMAIPYLLTPEMECVYNRRILTLVSAHIARSLARDRPHVVEAVNDVIRPLIEEDAEAKELAGLLVDVDDRSLFTRILVPEMVEVARERYPQRDPRIDREVADMIRVLSALARGGTERVESPFCRSYFRAVFVLVARPEKIAKMLVPHVEFVKRSLERCPDTRSVYILVAGRNVIAAKYLLSLLKDELEKENIEIENVEEYEYRGRYKGLPSVPLYLCRIKLAEKVIAARTTLLGYTPTLERGA